MLNLNAELLPGMETCIVGQPPACDPEPQVQRLAVAVVVEGLPSVTVHVALALHRDEPFRDGGTCFKIGVSHDQLLR